MFRKDDETIEVEKPGKLKGGTRGKGKYQKYGTDTA